MPKRFPRDIQQESVEKLLAAIGVGRFLERRDRAIIMFLWDTGVRVTELCELKLADLDLEGTQAIIRDGKGEVDPNVSFGVRAKNLVEDWLEVRDERASCDCVLLNRSGKPLTRWGVQTMLSRRKAEVRVGGPCNPHAFRHGFAMTYLDNGGNIYSLQHLMGHASLNSTMVYLNPTDRRAHRDHRKASPGDHLTGL